MDKRIHIDNLFKTIEKEGYSLYETIRIFNEEFNSVSEKESDEQDGTKGVWEALGINISFRFGLQESAIKSLLETFPKNDEEDKVLAKVVLINQLYRTGLNDTVSQKTISVSDMARHIVKKAREENLDQKIQNGNLEAVTLIGSLPKYNDAFSFASKYCNWHNIVVYHCDDYSIMDSYAKGFIYYWSKTQPDGSKYTQKDLAQYPKYHEAVLDFRKKKCKKLTLKEIDSFLWIYGKAKGLAIS